MKSISIDFKNKKLCIMIEGQRGVEYCDVAKDTVSEFIPEKFKEYTSFTWNFENDTFAANQEYALEKNAIMTEDCFIPQCIIPMPNLHKKFNKFIKLLGMEQVDSEEMRKEIDKILDFARKIW